MIAVWDGGMQFSGGLLFGAVVGWWSARGRYSRTQRWHVMDGSAVGLTVGMAVGRLGCLAVGEHFGGPTDFVLGMTYVGGGTVEPVALNETIHNTAFYEFLHLTLLAAIFAVLLRQAGDRQRPWPLGMLGAIFLVWYGAFRFLTDSVRVNDTRLAGLTGAQWACIVLVGLGAWLVVTMPGRRASQQGRAVVPVTMEPQSAVKLVPSSAATPDDAPDDQPSAAIDDDRGRESRADARDVTSATDDAPTASATTTNWADRADVRDGSAGFVAGVRVVTTPDGGDDDQADHDQAAGDEVADEAGSDAPQAVDRAPGD